MANTKIVLDADHGRADQAAVATAKKYKHIADAAGDVGRNVEKAEKSGDKFLRQTINIGLRFALIAKASKMVVDHLEKIRQQQMDVNKEVGAGAMDRGAIMRQLGLDKMEGGKEAALAAMTGGVGFKTQEEIDAHWQRVAADQAKKKGKKATPQELLGQFELFQTALFSDEEIYGQGASGRGQGKLREMMAGRASGLTAAEKQERAVRLEQRMAYLDEVRNLNSPEAAAERAKQANYEAFKKRNPVLSSIAEWTAWMGGERALRKYALEGEVPFSNTLSHLPSSRAIEEIRKRSGVPAPKTQSDMILERMSRATQAVESYAKPTPTLSTDVGN